MSFSECFGVFSLFVLFAWLASKLAKGVWSNWLADAFGYGVKWCPRANSYAVITGATDGIGLAYAQQLASKGYSLLLISRNEDKLNKTKEEIQSQYSKCAQIRTLAVDFTRNDIYEKIEKELQQLDDIHVLVNNVGISYVYPEYFTQIPDASDLIASIVNANVLSCTRLIHAILPKMEARRSGIIINISSYSASYPTPLLTLYAATKVYMDYLSRALQAEYEDKGITIQSVLPAFVATNMSKIRRTSAMVPSARDYAKSALKTVGVETRTYGYWAHKLQGFAQDCLIANTLGSQFNVKLAFDSMKNVRRKYYRNKGIKEKSN